MKDCRLEVLFTPADFGTLGDRDLSQTTCVVFDVLRATSSMVSALAHGATAVIPVGQISEALALRRSDPTLLLAGERDGLRISGALAGGTEFDLGNSPREFSTDRVQGRQIAMTTTNGTRALRAASAARNVLIGSFLNLTATSKCIEKLAPAELILVCSGTYEGSAYEDVLGAGALCDLLWPQFENNSASDSAQIARQIYVAGHG